MKNIKNEFNELKTFLALWSTQALSQLGSSVTCFALTLWLYEKTGSALSTAALTICNYLPYVLMSIFAGALTDKFDKKKTMLAADLFAALCTVTVFILYRTEALAVWHLYALNVLSGLMNTVQQPASEVAMTMITPKQHYQRASGLKSLSRSLVSILNPLIATALYALAGMTVVIAVDLFSFAVAFVTLLCFIDIPKTEHKQEENVLTLAKEGLGYLKKTPILLTLLLFMSGVNLVASAFDAVLPGLVLPNPRGGEAVLGVVTSCAGLAMLAGSLIVSLMPKPKDRVRVVYLTMLFSLGIENFMLAFSRNPVLWCVGQVIGWILVPVMSTNLEVIMRNTIPLELQGRVYACRNTLQFFTIPIGLFLGGWLVDEAFEPLMEAYGGGFLNVLFGTGKGSGAAFVMFVLGVAGIVLCLASGARLKKYHYSED